MDSITLRLESDTIEALDTEAGEHGVSRSEYVRDILQSRHERDRLRAANERLQQRVQTLIDQREEHSELVNYVQEERSLQQRREERRDAPLWTRAKWYVLGRD